MSDTANISFEKQLKQYRNEIDAIDATLIDLILKRSEVVGKVGLLKENAGEKTCQLRPAREAAQLKKMMERFASEAFPAAAAVHIWRHIINGSLAIEGTLPIGVWSAVGATSDLVWMSREYFGAYGEMIRESHPHALVHKVASNQCAIGILPYPTSEDTNPWWLDLANEGDDKPTIFLKLPFLPEAPQAKHGGGNGNSQALAIAKISPETYGECGITAIAMRTENTCSIGKLQDAFKHVGLNAKWVSTSVLSEMERAHFVEVEGNVNSDNALYSEISNFIGNALIKIAVIGHYAAPLSNDIKK